MAAVPELVTFEQAKRQVEAEDLQHLDALIEEKRQMAIAALLNYIKQYPRGEFDTLPVYDVDNPPTITWGWPIPVGGTPPYWWPAQKPIYRELPPYVVDDWFGSPGPNVPWDIQAACLLLIAVMVDDRTGERDPFTPGVVSLLERWRDPTMA